MTTDLRPTGGEVFISYAHADNSGPQSLDRWLDRLLEHLHSVQLDSASSIWSDVDIRYGEDWHKAIQTSLAQSKVAVLLVSSAFLTSEYIRDHELPLLLQRRDKDGLLVIPLVVRPCAFKEATYRYPSPHDGPEQLRLSTLHSPAPQSKPLSSLQPHQQDQVLSDLATHIKQFVDGRDPSKVAVSAITIPALRPVSTKGGFGLTAALLLMIVSVPIIIWRPWNADVLQPAPIRPPTPSVLFGSLSASDIERLRGATENDVIRLALESESEQIRHLAEVFENRPAVILSLIHVLVESRSNQTTATIELSDSDLRRLAGATKQDVIRLALECESESIRNLAEAFANQPTLLLEFVKEVTTWQESRSP